MALSGSFYVNVGARWRLQLEWSATQSVENNYSSVTAKLYWIALDSYGAVNSTASKTASITISGTSHTNTAAGLAALKANEKKLVNTYQKVIYHNADGTASATFDGYFEVEATLAGTYIGTVHLDARTFQLNTIPRASKISSSANWTAGADLTISLTRASSTFDHLLYIYVFRETGEAVKIKEIRYSTSQTSLNSNFTFTENQLIFNVLAGRSQGTTELYLRTYNNGSYVGEHRVRGTIYKPAISAISSETDLDRYVDQDVNLIINSGHPDYNHTVRITMGSFSAEMANVKDTALFQWTATQQNLLYSEMSNVKMKEANLELISFFGVERVGTYNTTMRFYVWASEPIFSDSFTYEDINNSIITTITADKTKILQNKSQVRVTIPTTAKAVAQNQATMVQYRINLAGVEIVKPWSDTADIVADFGVITAPNDQTLSITAIDSRGNATTRVKTVSVLPYATPTILGNARRKGGFDEATNILVNGEFSPVNVNGANKNGIQKLQYRYRKATESTTVSTWANPQTINYTTSGSIYTGVMQEVSFDNTSSFIVDFIVADKLEERIVTVNVSPGQPIFFIDSDKKSIGVNKFPERNSTLEVNGDVETKNITASGNLQVSGDTSLDGLIFLGDMRIRKSGMNLYFEPTIDDANNLDPYYFVWRGDFQIQRSTIYLYNGNIEFTGGATQALRMPNGIINGVNNNSAIELQDDSWLRINNNSDYGGVYFGGATTRISGTLEVGTNGVGFRVSPTGEATTGLKERGFCGYGTIHNGKSANTQVGGVGVNFRTKKTYTPSSITLTVTNWYGLNANVTEITQDGFWLYMTVSIGGYTGHAYWRGYYDA